MIIIIIIICDKNYILMIKLIDIHSAEDESVN